MTAVPVAALLTMPDVGVTAAMLVSEEVHSPPVVASVNIVVAPEQIEKVPLMVDGKGLTVNVARVAQPVVALV